jgi:hypothetical protein
VNSIFFFKNYQKLKFTSNGERRAPHGPTFVGMGNGTPEVPELPSAQGYNWATRPLRDINSGDWPSRLGVGREASDLTSGKHILL